MDKELAEGISVFLLLSSVTYLFHYGATKAYKKVSDKVLDAYYVPESGKRALLIQQAPEDSIDLMNTLLRKRRYERRIINPDEATKDNIFESIDQLAQESDSDSQTVFYYSGHGFHIQDNTFRKGISVNGDYNFNHERRIEPIALYQALGKINGKKSIILDCCFSGEFVDTLKDGWINAVYPNLINDYVVLSSCPADNVSISSIRYLKNKDIGSLSFGLHNALNKNKSPINISDVEILCGDESDRNNPGAIKVNDGSENNNHNISFEMQRISDTDFYL